MQPTDIVLKSLQYIDDNLNEQIRLEKISSYFGYSTYYFSRIFKNVMGISVMRYVKKRKLIKASDAIIRGQKIIDAAMDYGYMSQSSFTKAFKQEFGFSPSILKAMIVQIEYFGGNDMKCVFYNQTNIHLTKDELYSILEKEWNNLGLNNKELSKIYEFACNSYKDRKRYSGDDYITHLLNVAIILTQMEASSNVILAGLMCDILVKTDVTEEELLQKIPKDIAKLVMESNTFHMSEDFSSDNDDVIMIKLAERLHNMRTIDFMEDVKQKMKAKETIELFLPLANKIQNNKLIAELNDLALKYV